MFDCTSFLFFFVNAYPNMLIVPSFFATGDGGGPIERGNMPSYEEEQEKAFFNVRGVPARTRVHLYRGAVLVTAWGEGIRIKVVFSYIGSAVTLLMFVKLLGMPSYVGEHDRSLFVMRLSIVLLLIGSHVRSAVGTHDE